MEEERNEKEEEEKEEKEDSEASFTKKKKQSMQRRKEGPDNFSLDCPNWATLSRLDTENLKFQRQPILVILAKCINL